MAKKQVGRKRGSSNRGYFFRKGRGWYAVRQGRFVPLRDSDEHHLKAQKTKNTILQTAYARLLLEEQQQNKLKQNQHADLTVLEVCQAYLQHAKATGSAKTHHDRADTLFDFCFGLPPEYRHKGEGPPPDNTPDRLSEMQAKRIHDGYGGKNISEIRKFDIDQWLQAHPTWQGGRRARIQAVKRAFNYGVECDLIEKNPIRGYRTPRSVGRVTYITPAQEQACYDHANPAFSMAIYVCIRTGARFGCEFAALTDQHVIDHGDRMEWRFRVCEEKTRRKFRVIRIKDPKVIEYTRSQMKKSATGIVFRNSQGNPWSCKWLSHSFRRLKALLKKHGVEFDQDACMYSCRHTYAKRTLQGYWTGKPTNIETLARLMGNSPQVCRDHYLQWSEVDNEMLWEAA